MNSQGNFSKWFRYGSLVLFILMSFRTPFVAQVQAADNTDSTATMQEAADVPPVQEDLKIDAIVIDPVTVPNFPSCEQLSSAPGDQAHYTSGLHQIAGGDLLSGKDDVYTQTNGNAVQCFCPVSGVGIQTNWWATDTTLDGWIGIGNGTSWNLSDSAYLALNSNFDCNPPVLPNCETLTSSPGDLAHYTDGLHQIAGGDLLAGADDVYAQINGNAVQCFCPPTGVGIQTNWWKTDMSLGGWINVGNGLVWNLSDSAYLALNSNYDCTPAGGVQPGANITVTKVVVNDNEGTAVAGDFLLKVGQAVVTTGVLATNFPAGSFNVTESGGPSGYTATFSGDCDTNGHIVMAAGQTYTCTITNNDNGPAVVAPTGGGGGGGGGSSAVFTLTKVVVNDDDGDAQVSDFALKVGGISVISGVTSTFGAGTYVITETGPAGYATTFSGDCDSTGQVIMLLNQTYSCTMTNNDLPPVGGSNESGEIGQSGVQISAPAPALASAVISDPEVASTTTPVSGQIEGVSIAPIGGVEAGGLGMPTPTASATQILSLIILALSVFAIRKTLQTYNI